MASRRHDHLGSARAHDQRISAGDLTRDDVLDDFTLYWLTNSAISAARFYWELHLNLYNAANVSIPAAVSVFPGENYQAPRSWTEQAYDKLIYYNKVDKGGHYGHGNSATVPRRGSRGLQIAAILNVEIGSLIEPVIKEES